MDAIEERVRIFLAEYLEVGKKKITGNARFIDDLGMDSLDIIGLFAAFEGEFKIAIPDRDSEKLITVGALIEYIKGKTNRV